MVYISVVNSNNDVDNNKNKGQIFAPADTTSKLSAWKMRH